MPVPHLAKRIAGRGLGVVPHARFERCVFLIGHMRCGSTALANVLAAHPSISGYGESHVDYGRPAAPGRLVLNQIGARRWKPGARLLLDKLLHDRLDAAAPPGFFAARAIFLHRAPEPTLASILALGLPECPDVAAAVRYYAARLARMAALWDGFPPDRRLRLDHATLTADPGGALAAVTRLLALVPPLANAYRRSPSRHGAGDPLAAPRHVAIVAVPPRSGAALDPAMLATAQAAHADFLRRTAA